MATAPRPLLVTDEAAIREDVLRLAAVAGVAIETASDPGPARPHWQTAPLVLLGVDRVPACARAALPPRHGIVVVGHQSPSQELLAAAITCGAQRVLVLPDAEPALVDALADTREPNLNPARVVAVLAGRGGAGASVLAAALAVTAARCGHDPMLVDLDPCGGGADLILGAEQVPGLRWKDLAATSGRVSALALRDALPAAHGTVLLSFDRDCRTEPSAAAVRSILAAGRRMGDLVVVDLPRYDVASRSDALELVDTVLVVVPTEVRAVAAAARVVADVSGSVADVRAVVRHGPPEGAVTPDRVATALRLPIAGELRTEPGLDSALERGIPPARRGRGPLAALATHLLGSMTPARAEAA